MRLSLLLTSTDADSPSLQFRRHVRMVHLAEEYGFHTIVASHHFLSHPYAYFQPVELLARLAAETSLQLATGVLLLPMLNPVEVAESMATLDVMSDGRAVFGAGVGYRPDEFANLGVSQSKRGARFEESLDLILRLWQSKGPIDYDGQFFTLRNAAMTMKPVQQPHPPVWVAGMADKAIERAGRLGHAWYVNPNASMQTLRQQMVVYRGALSAAGHAGPDVLPVRREAYVAASGDAARERALGLVSARYKVYGEWDIRGNLPPSEWEAHDQARTATVLPGDGRFIVGDPEECANTLLSVEEAVGMPIEVVFRLQWPGITDAEIDENIRLLGQEIAPRVAEQSNRFQ